MSQPKKEQDQGRVERRESMKGYQAGMLGRECPDGASHWYRLGWANGRVDYETLLKIDSQKGKKP